MRILIYNGKICLYLFDVVWRSEPKFDFGFHYKLGLYRGFGIDFTLFGLKFGIAYQVSVQTYLKANAARLAWIAEEKKQPASPKKCS